MWGNLVYTAILLAAFSKLNSRGLYFSVSLAFAIALEAWLQYRKVAAPAAAPEAVSIEKGGFPKVLRAFLWSTLIAAAIGSAIICLAYVPNNWDSCTYRFSRAFFYLARGNLLHPGVSDDPRLLFYPFNGTLLYIFLATYAFSAKAMYLVTYLSWAFAGLGSYFVARCLKASARGAFVAAWICMLSPSVLSQAASTNDEVLAAVPILIGFGFALQWFATARLRYALLAGIGIGLGFGAKLHWMFYVLVVAGGALVLCARLFHDAQFRSSLKMRIPSLAAGAVVALPMAATFLLCSYLSSGKLTDVEYNNAILNRPFRTSLAREKIRINTAELLFSPIPDLTPPLDRNRRSEAYRNFNRFFMQGWLSDLVEVTKRSPEGYIFEGPANPDGVSPTEYTVWLGFFPHLLLLICCVALLTRRLPWAAVAVAASFFVWHATYATQNRYIPTASVYYSFPAVLAFAGIGPVWDWARASRRWPQYGMVAAFLAVIGTNLLLGANLLAFGGLRNLQFIWKNAAPPEMHAVDAGVAGAIRQAERIYIPYTHWEVLYWNFMRFHPGAAYSTGTEFRPPSRDIMMLLSVAREGGSDLIPAKLPADVEGLTYLGVADSEPIFAQGGGVGKRGNARRGYMLLPVTWTMDGAGRITGLRPGFSRPSQNVVCCAGLADTDGIEYRYELRSRASGGRLASEWYRPGGGDAGLGSGDKETYDTIVIETRRVGRPDLVSRTEHQIPVQHYKIPE